MSKNPIPVAHDALFIQASDLFDGLERQEGALGVKHHLAALAAADLEAARVAQRKYHTNLSECAEVLKPDLEEADLQARKFIVASRKVIGSFHGDRWSQAWLATGFMNNSTRIPRTVAGREALLESLAGYFAAHPDREVAGLGVTRKRVQEVHRGLAKARQRLQANQSAAVTLREERDKAVTALRKRISGVKSELRMLLDKNSPTWLAFGLKIPGQQTAHARKEAGAAGEKEKSKGKAAEGTVIPIESDRPEQAAA